MKYNLSYLKASLLLISFISSTKIQAQIDIQCNGRDEHSLFFVGAYFYRIDSIDTNPTNPIILDTNIISDGGISINPILDSVGSSETMYTTTNLGTYHYWNGSGWTNTGHYQGAPNPSGTSQYIFNLAPFSGIVYRYDGTSNSIPLVTGLTSTHHFIFDLATDNAGNFYILYTNAQKLVVFDPNGFSIDSFPVTGINTGGGYGLALLGGRIYACDSGGLKEGILVGNTYHFNVIVSIPNASFGVADMTSCTSAALPLAVISKKLATTIFTYPNPAQDCLNIKAEKLSDKSCMITITDFTGKSLRKEQITFTTNKAAIDVGQLKGGVYFLRIESPAGAFVQKFLKE